MRDPAIRFGSLREGHRSLYMPLKLLNSLWFCAATAARLVGGKAWRPGYHTGCHAPLVHASPNRRQSAEPENS